MTMGLFDKLFGRKDEDPANDKPAPPEAADNAPGDDADWQEQGTPQELQPAEVRELLAGDNPPVLVDVREKPELDASGWIPGAVHIPMSEFQERFRELDPAKPVVVYCAAGMRSFDAGFFLIENGFRDVANLNGGMHAWDGEVERA